MMLEYPGTMPLRLLFVCVENSCRSQMAEGYARALGGDGVEAWSAGSRPSGKVNETAVAMMREDGVDIAGHASKGLGGLPTVLWDAIVTMGCGDACPAVPAKRRIDWALPDPKHLSPDGFRKVRDDIKGLVRALLAQGR
jgi:protein-tyrosine-phosphatase